MEIKRLKIHILCFVFFLLNTMVKSTADRSVYCPQQCECVPRQLLNCQGRGLDRLPQFEITYHMVFVDFSQNNLTIVSLQDFSGLLARKLDLSYNSMSIINPAIELALTFNVEETLNLSHNVLTSFPAELLNHTRYVNIIDLSHNSITSLPKKIIYYQTELTKLILAFNHVVFVHPLAFINVNSLREVDLRNNYLTQISPKLEMTSGQILLGGNPWICDCGQKWILSNENFTSTPSPPTCQEPLLVAGQSVTSLKEEDFVCPPRYNNGSLLVQSRLGGRVELICPAEGDPEITEVMWSFRGQHPSYTIASKPDKPLIIQSVTEATVGRYWCTVWNKGGNLTMSISLSIRRTDPETTEAVPTVGLFTSKVLNSSQLPMPVESDFKVPIFGIFALTSLLLILLFLVLGLGAYTHNLRNRLKHKRAVAREGMFSWQSSFPTIGSYANAERATLPVEGGYMYLLQNARQRDRTGCDRTGYRQDDGRCRGLMLQQSEYASTRKRVLPVAPAVAPTSGPHGMYGYDSEHLYDTLGARCFSSCSESSSQMSVAI